MADHNVFYRPAELTLLIEPLNPAIPAGIDQVDPIVLQPLESQIPNFDGTGSPALVIRRLRGGLGGTVDVTRILHTVRLVGWVSDAQFSTLEASGLQADRSRREQLVQIVADVIAALAAPADLPQTAEFRVDAVSPNWLAAPALNICLGGSPGSLPVPADPAKTPTFRNDGKGADPVDGKLWEVLDAQGVPREVPDAQGVLQPVPKPTGNGIGVAVFDTWPTAAIAAAGGAFAGFPVPKVVAPPTPPDGVHSLRRRPNGTVEPAYNEADHGLFVAGIVRDLAPDAVLSIYQVLNDFGIGDLQTIAGAVQTAVLGRPAGSKLVLNLSLGIGMHALLVGELLKDPVAYYNSSDILQQAIDRLGPNGSQRGGRDELTMLKALNIVKDLGAGGYQFTGLFAAVDHLFAFKHDPDVLAVAATGNNSDGGSHFGPRVPAAIEGVLAISAMLPGVDPNDPSKWGLAGYSNDDDLFPDNDGIGAFGGDVNLATGVVSAPSAVIGRFASANVPPPFLGKAAAGQPVNNTGWARWSGTSFATPVVAGFAASLWSGKPDWKASEVRALVATGPDSHLDFLQDP